MRQQLDAPVGTCLGDPQVELSDYRQKGHDLKVISQDFTNLLVTDDIWWQHRQQTYDMEILEEHSSKKQRKWTWSWLSRKWNISQWSKKGNSYIREPHFGQMKYSTSVVCVSGTEIEKCTFCPMNSCLEQAIAQPTGYEHNHFIFSQFIWSWMTGNMHNSRVNMNTIISRENTFPLWHCFFYQPFGLIIIYLPTRENDLLTLTIQARNNRGAVE